MVTAAESLSWTIAAEIALVEAPEEMELLADIVTQHGQNATYIRDEALGFGAGEIQILAVTVFNCLMQVIGAFAPKLLEVAGDVSKAVLIKRLTSLQVPGGSSNKAMGSPPVGSAISPDLLARVHAATVEACTDRRLSAGTAEAVAASLVAKLALGRSHD
jgi:hypothetical protein